MTPWQQLLAKVEQAHRGRQPTEAELRVLAIGEQIKAEREQRRAEREARRQANGGTL